MYFESYFLICTFHRDVNYTIIAVNITDSHLPAEKEVKALWDYF